MQYPQYQVYPQYPVIRPQQEPELVDVVITSSTSHLFRWSVFSLPRSPASSGISLNLRTWLVSHAVIFIFVSSVQLLQSAVGHDISLPLRPS